MLGDGRSAALVDRHGSIDWLCWPSFDSDTCFAALLGDARNGCWRIAPRKPVLSAKRCYRGDGLILETTLVAGPSTVILTDWMVWGATPPVLARRVRCEGAPVSIECELTVRFDYGRAVPWSKQAGSRVQLMAGPQTFWLDSSAELNCVGNDVRMSFNMAPGEQRDFSLTCVPSTSPPPAVPDLNTALDTTAAFWSGWSARSAATGPYAEAIQRSMVTLKALTSLETGGVIAAPTSSLPEAIGGQRNWDYRFCWLRDASFTLKALLAGGYHDEAARWRDWLVRAIGGDPAQVQIMYALDGTRRVDEWECTWLPGYEHSAPVRFGNAAVGQLQLDVYGEVLNALYVCRQAGLPPDDGRLVTGTRAGRPSGECLARTGPWHLGSAQWSQSVHVVQGHGVGRGGSRLALRPGVRQAGSHRGLATPCRTHPRGCACARLQSTSQHLHADLWR